MADSDSITPLPFAGVYGRQAIVTRYYGPTNTRGSRVKATCDAGSLTVSWDYALDAPENHAAAVYALAHKLGWAGEWILGGMPQASRDAYVAVPACSGKFTVRGDA